MANPKKARPAENAHNEEAEWRRMLDEALEQTGGRLTKKERGWADAILIGGESAKAQKNRKARATPRTSGSRLPTH